MGFDTQNFGLGLLAGWGSGYVLYRARRPLGRLIRRVRQADGRSPRRGIEARYLRALTPRLERIHLAGAFVPLRDLLVEPRFLPAARLLAADADEAQKDVYDLVPRVYDHPFLHAPYPLDTLSVEELAGGTRLLAVLGEPGSGRTTALLTLALYSAGQVEFGATHDQVQQGLEVEDARVEGQRGAGLIRERLLLEQRAREQLPEGSGANVVPGSLFRDLLPLYVHIADLIVTARRLPEPIDPAELLVRAIQDRIGGRTAKVIPALLYRRLNSGTALVLIDGWDDLPASRRAQYTGWLRAILEHYRGNFFVVAGPTRGYRPLLEMGLTPVYLRAWSDLDIQRAAERWSNAWPAFASKRKSGTSPDAGTAQHARAGTRGLLPFEITLKMWSAFAGDQQDPGVEGWIVGYISRHLPEGESLDVLLPQVMQLAASEVESGFVTSGPGDVTDESPIVDTASFGHLFPMLEASGILQRYDENRYRYRHTSLAAYLASYTLHGLEAEELAERALDPVWNHTLAYTALHTDLLPAINARLTTPADILHENVLCLARWLAYASPSVTWRSDVLRVLGNLMLMPIQFPLVRERATAALLSTRDLNALVFFRRGVRMANPDIRRLSCLGMGALGDRDALRDLIPLMNDPDPNVQLAATMAVGVIPAEDALEAMLVSLTEGSEPVRKATTIALAAMPDDGYAILHDAVSDGDMLLRRAAVFGLKRIRASWALIDIYRTFLEDDQWYVRSAAQDAFQESQFGRQVDFATLVDPARLPWLKDWVARNARSSALSSDVSEWLALALAQGDPDIRTKAAAALGQLSAVARAAALYAALRDQTDTVRSMAYRALGELQSQAGLALPAPV